jgi:hypothetical protein
VITIVALRQGRGGSVGLLTHGIIRIALIAVVGEIAGSVIAHRRASPGIRRQSIVHITGPLLQPRIEPPAPADAIPHVAHLIITIGLRVWTILRAALSNQIHSALVILHLDLTAIL